MEYCTKYLQQASTSYSKIKTPIFSWNAQEKKIFIKDFDSTDLLGQKTG